MRIGIFGGTFNPIHYGHLISANEILERFFLDKVIFVPVAQPPHKRSEGLLDARHRWMMAILATLSHSRLEVSDLEIQRGGQSYSINTIEEIKRFSSPDTELLFITGCDAFMEISTWKDVDRLLKSCHFIVTSRPGYKTDSLMGMLSETVAPLYHDLFFNEAGRDPITRCPRIEVVSSPCFIYLVEIPAMDLSSSEIRRRIAEGRTIRYLVPWSVEEYVIKNGLYRERP